MKVHSTQRYDDLVEQAGGLADSHRWLVEQVPAGATVLDCGSAGGYMAKALLAKDCTVDGLDVDIEAADRARPLYRRFWVGSLEDGRFLSELGDGYDRILFGDVLEHLRDPGAVLRNVRPLLAPGGRILISIPNVAHWRLRWSLLRGRFEYEDAGLLDHTHLRFYTFETARKLIEESGFRIIQHDFTLGPPPSVIGWRFITRALKQFENLAAYQTFIEAERE